ncbi:MAG: peptidase inhibitor I78 [Phenylobacterium sp.]|uniref:peptidase inhibitor I78 n=1 Tax=Phenylobacterium sp. TaxID=1871053 RepID=UPI002719214C|nr:peptidase inhibitor I78 [Phenylobacterium sp.]MDO8900883.1 peptidase inhibitor I78 [Phenylobacterium sp.]MDP2213679.1 peptidase inhibitor I78 [Phenylobacterium sp.]
MTRKLAFALGVSLLMLGACASEGPGPAPPPNYPAPQPQPQPAPPADQCGAAAAQRLVGRHRSEIPVPLNPGLQRVACTTCPVTMDFHPRRLNFFYEAATGVIKEVRCG